MTVLTGYICVFAISLLCAAMYIFMWHKHFDITFSMVFTIVPITCLGYVMYAGADTMQEAILAMKINYIGGCFLQYFIMLSVFNICKVDLARWIRTVLFMMCAIMYAAVLSIGYRDWFYRNISFSVKNGVSALYREYGPMHGVFYGLLNVFLCVSVITIIYALFRKKEVPRLLILLLMLPDLICIICYFAGTAVDGIELLSFGYLAAEIVYLVIAYKVSMYNVSDTAIDSMVQDGAVGFITFDLNKKYLGSNNTAKGLMPQIRELPVDRVPDRDRGAGKELLHWLDRFQEDENNNIFSYTVGGAGGAADAGGSMEDDRIYQVEVKYLYGDHRRRGYMIVFTDDTQKQRNIRLLENYKRDLEREVDEKTRHIVEMHDNLIMSLAMMVESRDNSTGGHIMRTSEGVRILIDAIEEEGALDLPLKTRKDIIKAAPMHDLGKIAVDDAILRKPGRFTSGEFNEMKHHTVEGARVVHETLKNTDDASFKAVAENIAHYHHERWDGSGYPEGLAGEDIPVEARIMAIADVYDALVSKRVYKESMSFEAANEIIIEGMGTQFDPALRASYERARPRLEEYYSALGD